MDLENILVFLMKGRNLLMETDEKVSFYSDKSIYELWSHHGQVAGNYFASVPKTSIWYCKMND